MLLNVVSASAINAKDQTRFWKSRYKTCRKSVSVRRRECDEDFFSGSCLALRSIAVYIQSSRLAQSAVLDRSQECQSFGLTFHSVFVSFKKLN